MVDGRWAWRTACAILILIPFAGGCAAERRLACRPGQRPHPAPDPPDPAGLAPYTHSHNDFVRARPLYDALDRRVASVEADVYFRDGAFVVAHENMPEAIKGTLTGLYLDPLARWIDEHEGWVYGRGSRFTLVLDLKAPYPGFAEALRALLDRYAFLTVFTDDAVSEGAVTVLLSGDADTKAAVVDAPVRRAARDSNDYDLDDPGDLDHRWLAYALDWTDYLRWDGAGQMDGVDQDALACLVENSARGGRSLRLFNAPDNALSWQVQAARGVRFINSDLPVDAR